MVTIPVLYFSSSTGTTLPIIYRYRYWDDFVLSVKQCAITLRFDSSPEQILPLVSHIKVTVSHQLKLQFCEGISSHLKGHFGSLEDPTGPVKRQIFESKIYI